MAIVVNSAGRLDRLPVSAFHRRILWLVSLGVFFNSFDISLQGGVLGSLLESGWSTIDQNATFLSATFIGLAIGAIAAGFLGDRYGRRFCYQFNLLVFGLASFAAAAAPSMDWLIAARLIIGIGLGAELVVSYSIVAEFVTPSFRGRAISYIGLGAMVGVVASTTLSFVVISTIGWRWMFALAGLGAMWVWYLRKAMPESPRWLEAAGRDQEAEEIVSAIEREAAQGQPLPPVAATIPPKPTTVPISVVFSKPVIRRTLLAMLINVAIGAANYGFITWLPTFFVKQGFDVSKSLGFAAVMQVGAVLGPLLSIALADRVGRKWGIVFASTSAAVLGMIYPYLTSAIPILVCGFFLVGSIFLFLTLGIASYTPELFPTEYRLRATGVAQFTGRVATIGVPFAVVALFNAYGVTGVVFSLAALLLSVALIVAIFGIETRRKSLETIGSGEHP